MSFQYRSNTIECITKLCQKLVIAWGLTVTVTGIHRTVVLQKRVNVIDIEFNFNRMCFSRKKDIQMGADYSF